MGTPDGRRGWADFFVEQGYVVYMMEQPMRGRSAWHPSDGATRMFRVDEEERLFTDNARSGNWPQAKKQTQAMAKAWNCIGVTAGHVPVLEGNCASCGAR